MKILITNNALSQRAGTELYVRDVALALQRRGYSPFVYSSIIGDVANEIREAAIPVVNDLSSLSITPDIIHGQHHLETMTALLHFPKVPGVYFCHGWNPWQESAPQFSRILKYIAVDKAVHDRLVFEQGIPEERVNIILNFVDLQKFKPRGSLPQRPQRALFFSNHASEKNIVTMVKEVCQSAGITLDVVGQNMQNSCPSPEILLGCYDLVFARGRSAIEAMATGVAVILLDTKKTGPMVTTANFDRLRLLNFGIRTREEVVNVDALLREIKRYDPADAALVCQRIRQTAGLEDAVDKIISTYQEVLEAGKHASPSNTENELKQIARYLYTLSPRIKENEELNIKLHILLKNPLALAFNFLFKIPWIGSLLKTRIKTIYTESNSKFSISSCAKIPADEKS